MNRLLEMKIIYYYPRIFNSGWWEILSYLLFDNLLLNVHKEANNDICP